MKRIIWLILVGSMIAFHNVYREEFKKVDQIEVVQNQDEED